MTRKYAKTIFMDNILNNQLNYNLQKSLKHTKFKKKLI